MKRVVEIEYYDQIGLLKVYTIRFKSEETEFDKFLEEFDTQENQEELDVLLGDFQKLGKKGAHERNLRYEGKAKDHLFALPSHLVDCKLRLFLLRISEDVVILGNGYKKHTKSYNQDPVALKHATTLLSIDKILTKRLNKLTISLYHQQIFGNTTFEIEV